MTRLISRTVGWSTSIVSLPLCPVVVVLTILAVYFDDGTNPTLEMTREFIDLSDRVISAGGVVAVHCKAGLGRTGTLIGAYLIYKHGFTASEGTFRLPLPDYLLTRSLSLAIGFMRLMRPGSCVGPQQHYLYENQMTWIRWGAIDSLSPRSPLALDRPITPPNEILLSHSRSRQTTPTAPTPSAAAPPRTPGRVVAVPGQPRKTPGKSKHSVATPETVDVDPTPLAQDDDFDILDTLPRIASTSTLKKQPPPSPTKAAPVTGGRPTRIARARTRPLSAIADNRIVDLLSTTSEMRRARSVKDLGTLFEAPPVEGEEEEEEEESGGGRYELRGSGSGRSTPIGGRAPIASPSRLPTRVPAKRRGAAGVVGSTNRVRERALTSAPGTAGGAISYLLEGGITGAVGRKVRRRRSSLGSTDFVQSV
jgi:cell division cycle 14